MDRQPPVSKSNRYSQLIERIFERNHRVGAREFTFERSELELVVSELDVKLPKNLGDIIYSFRYRAELPQSVRDRLPEGASNWIIWPAGASRYRFTATDRDVSITPNPAMAKVLIPDSTPGVIAKYALTDEQALLARIRYCRLLDIFTGITVYSFQSHLRTHVAGMGQVETDEIYVGIDKRGSHYIFPVQAKGKRDKLSIVQVAQDLALCGSKFPNLVCRSISAQFMTDDSIALFSFESMTDDSLPVMVAERHYSLVPFDDLTDVELQRYQTAQLEATI